MVLNVLQGFPDYYVFVGTDKTTPRGGPLIASRSIRSRFKQVGNAVAPPVAAALGEQQTC